MCNAHNMYYRHIKATAECDDDIMAGRNSSILWNILVLIILELLWSTG